MTTLAPHIEQVWIEQAVEKCHNDPDPGIWNIRQARLPKNLRTLHRRWRELNEVIGAPVADTWMLAAAIGGGVCLAVIIAVAIGAQDTFGTPEKPNPIRAGLVGAMPGLLIGFLVSYFRWTKMVFQETYIEVIVSEYQSSIHLSGSDSEDTVVASLPRLGFVLRPDCIEGNRGQTGFRDKDARIRLRTNFGQSYHDLRRAKDFFDLPTDDNWLAQAPAMERYSMETLVRMAGTLYRLYGVPRAADTGFGKLSGIWHWLVFIAALVFAVFMLAD